MIHPTAWLIWLISSLAVITLTRNPLYLILVFLIANLLDLARRKTTGNNEQSPFSPVKFSGVVLIFSMLINGITSHTGTHILFHIPWLGAITIEALIYGVINGLVLSCIFSVFAVINQTIPVQAMIRYIPRAFHPLALVISIALTFVPATIRQFNAIRDAQTIRGHRLRTISDWLPLFLPLLIGGLERSMQLAEVMTARGFAVSRVNHQKRIQIALLAGLLLFISGWLAALLPATRWFGLIAIIFGTILLGTAFWRGGAQHPRTIYQIYHWKTADSLLAIASILPALLFIFAIPGMDGSSRFYTPYPTLLFPRFDIFLGSSLMGLLAPLLRISRYDSD